jgi:hypothetical protein
LKTIGGLRLTVAEFSQLKQETLREAGGLNMRSKALPTLANSDFPLVNGPIQQATSIVRNAGNSRGLNDATLAEFMKGANLDFGAVNSPGDESRRTTLAEQKGPREKADDVHAQANREPDDRRSADDPGDAKVPTNSDSPGKTSKAPIDPDRAVDELRKAAADTPNLNLKLTNSRSGLNF